MLLTACLAAGAAMGSGRKVRHGGGYMAWPWLQAVQVHSCF